jgi:hypothetical protein
MGERTQLIVNADFPAEKIKFGTVIHYQWGGGVTMLLDALNIIRELPSYSLLQYDNEADQFKLLDETMKTHDFEIKNPSLYRQLYNFIIKSTLSGVPNQYYNPVQLQDQLKKYKDKPKEKEYVMYNILYTFCSDPDDFYLQCDNNDGYMVINVKYINAEEMDIEVGFAIESDPYATISQRVDTFKYLSFENFCRQYIYREDCNQDFQAGYKLLLHSLGIDFMDEKLKNKALENNRIV